MLSRTYRITHIIWVIIITLTVVWGLTVAASHIKSPVRRPFPEYLSKKLLSGRTPLGRKLSQWMPSPATALLPALSPLPGNSHLDTSFGGAGKVTTAFGSPFLSGGILATARQNDGKIIAVGYVHKGGTNYDYAVARYNTNGSLDTSFSGDGLFTYDFAVGDSWDAATAVTTDSSRNIYVAGFTIGAGIDFAVIKLNSDGKQDTFYGTNGKAVYDSGTPDYASGIAIQSDRSIVVTGSSYTGLTNSVSNFDLTAVRFSSTGTLDTSFGTNGKTVVTFGASTDEGLALAVQPDGKIVIAGDADTGGNKDVAVVRLTSNGALDTSFDGDGKVTTPIGSGDDIGFAVAVAPSGKIVVAGQTYNGSNLDFGVVVFNANGSLDTSFDGDGKVTTPIGSGDDRADAVAVQSDGKIIAGGRANNGATGVDFALTRYNPNGSLDTADWGTNGILTLDFGGADEVQDILIDSFQGLASAWRVTIAGTGGGNFALARLLPNTAPFYSGGTYDASVTRGYTTLHAIDFVGDPDQDSDTLVFSVSADGVTFGASATKNGVTISNLRQTANINFDLNPSCTATDAAFTLKVTDNTGKSALKKINVTIKTLQYTNLSLFLKDAKTLNPTTYIYDDDFASISVQSKGSYTGTVSVNANGVVSFSNAAPAGTHTITIRALDGCGQANDATINLTVYPIDSPTCISTLNYTRKTGANGLSNVVIDVFASGNTVYAGVNGGLAISTDGGNSFTMKTTANGLNDNFVTSVFVSGGTIYAGNDGLSISTDGGNTFTTKTIANGLGSNSIRDLFAANDSFNTIYAATANGLSISYDGGNSFTTKTTVNGLGHNRVNAVFVTGNTVYAATSGGFGTSGGVSISTNGGNSFVNKTTANGLPTDEVNDVFVFGNTIYAATRDGLAISTDGGNSFITKTKENSGLVDTQVRSVFVSGGAIYAATFFGLSVSTNGGNSFINITPNDGFGGVQSFKTIVASGNTVYAGIDNGGGLVIYKCPVAPPTLIPASALTRQQGSSGSVSTIATVSDSSLAAGNLTVTATSIPPGITVSNITNTDGTISANIATSCSASLGNNTIVLQVSNGGLTATANLVVNVTANAPPAVSYLNANLYPGSSTTQSIATASDHGSIVSYSLLSQGTYTGTVSVDAKGVVSLSNAGSIGMHTITIRATDNCGATGDTTLTVTVLPLNSLSCSNTITFTRKTTPNPLDSDNIYDMFVTGNTIYLATDAGLLISTDGGNNFVARTTTHGLGSNSTTSVFAIGQTIYVGLSTSGVSISTDGGNSFITKTVADGLGSKFVRSVYALGNNVYVGTDLGLSISTNNGSNFTNKKFIPDGYNAVNDVFVVSNTIYIAANSGLWISADNGNTFANKTTAHGLGNDSVYSLFVEGNNVYAGTPGGLSISTDNGNSFTHKAIATEPSNNRVESVYVAGSTIYAGTIAYLWISTDGGNTFSRKDNTNGLTGNSVRAVFATSDKVYVGTLNYVGFFIGSCPTPPPTITTINPATANAGSASITLTVTGTNFVNGAKVRWNSTELATTFGNSTSLTATVSAAELTTPGTANITVANPAGGGLSNAVPFTVRYAGARNLRIGSGSATPGSTVKIPVELVAEGNENAVGFSLSFNLAHLTQPIAVLGSDAANAQLLVNSTALASGKIGLLLTLPPGQTFAAGTRQLVSITFNVANLSQSITTPLSVGDEPVKTEISSATGAALPFNTAPGTLAIGTGSEADVSPRPNGNNNGSVTIADWSQVGRFVAGLDTPAVGGEFQRTDCAPRATFGDGKISLLDWVQAGRYAAGLDPVSNAAGPTQLAAALVPAFAEADAPRIVRARNAQWLRGQVNSLQIEVAAQGNENALAFSLGFDPRLLSFIGAQAGNGAAVTVNQKLAAQGQLGFVLALPAGQQFAAGTRSALQVQFVPGGDNRAVSTTIRFTDQVVVREIADASARALTAVTYANAELALSGRAVANVSAANYQGYDAAADSIVSAFGAELATQTAAAKTTPLPTLLGNTRVMVTDSAGVERAAPLFFVSPTQVNYLVPANTAEGLATVIVTNSAGQLARGVLNITRVAPGLFSADATGKGWAAAQVVYVNATGEQRWEAVARYDAAQSRFIVHPIEVASAPAYLILYGTGLKRRGSLAAVQAFVDGVEMPVEYAGAQEAYAGLDQINLKLAKSLAGRGAVTVALSIDGKPTNPVQIAIK